MAILLVALFVLVPFALLIADIVRGRGAKAVPYAGLAHAASTRDDRPGARTPAAARS